MKEPFFTIDERIETLCRQAEEQCAGIFRQIDDTADYNARKVLAAFIRNRVSEPMFAGTTGYGYGDIGREALDAVLADIFGCEDALIRHNFVSGTHALTTALFGVLRPGDTIVSLTGRPYDTLEEVVGLRGEGHGSLKEWGVTFRMQELAPDGHIDFDAIPAAVQGARVAYIQRSRGYTLRPSVTVAEIARVVELVKKASPDTIVMVDNCYGEFVERQEPTEVGAELIIGSLIKNPGGGIARTGGYIAGRADLVELCAHRLSAPGVGGEIGCTLDMLRGMYLGLYYAPGVVCEALKTSVYAACLFELLGYAATPAYGAQRNDIITSVETGSPEGMVALCGGVQAGSPVDSFAAPEPGDMPGYEDPVIMAAGAFTMGSSIEFSADGPLRAPYTVYMQGGLNFAAARAGVLLGADRMLRLRRSE